MIYHLVKDQHVKSCYSNYKICWSLAHFRLFAVLSLARICQVLVPLFSVAKESAKMSGDAANEESGSNLPTIADDLVVTKYKMAAEITNSESEWANSNLPWCMVDNYIPFL